MKKTEPAFGAQGRLAWLEPANPDAELLFLRVAPDGKRFRCFFDIEPVGPVAGPRFISPQATSPLMGSPFD